MGDPPRHSLRKKKPGTRPKPPKPKPPKGPKQRPRQVRLKLPKKRGRKKKPEDAKESGDVPMEEEVCELRDPEQAPTEGEPGLVPKAKPKGRLKKVAVPKHLAVQAKVAPKREARVDSKRALTLFVKAENDEDKHPDDMIVSNDERIYCERWERTFKRRTSAGA